MPTKCCCCLQLVAGKPHVIVTDRFFGVHGPHSVPSPPGML